MGAGGRAAILDEQGHLDRFQDRDAGTRETWAGDWALPGEDNLMRDARGVSTSRKGPRRSSEHTSSPGRGGASLARGRGLCYVELLPELLPAAVAGALAGSFGC